MDFTQTILRYIVSGGEKTDIFIVYFLQLISTVSRVYSGYFHNTQLIIDNIICINIKNIGGQVWVGNIVKKKRKKRKKMPEVGNWLFFIITIETGHHHFLWGGVSERGVVSTRPGNESQGPQEHEDAWIEQNKRNMLWFYFNKWQTCHFQPWGLADTDWPCREFSTVNIYMPGMET